MDLLSLVYLVHQRYHLVGQGVLLVVMGARHQIAVEVVDNKDNKVVMVVNNSQVANQVEFLALQVWVV